MTNNTPSGARKHRESTEPESRQTAKTFSFFFFTKFSASSSDGLVQICVTLLRWFSHKTAAFFTEQCTSLDQPIAFFQFEVIPGDSGEPLTEELWLPLRRQFFFTCTHAHKSLSNEM